ncbi:MAG: methylmalonyl-CoA epimerase [candidate division Zixibacteria bacterium]|jgi:methylmalonyl-CoA/ethylmalonyl-CoA epimerase|nr:methylmalonyl-CoA epimerase [candidate division Zixibacteria bacterium]
MSDALLSHAGIAVASLEDAVARYRVITGREPSMITEVADQKVRVAMFSVGGEHAGGRVELVAATSADSPIAKYIEKRGEGLHHICIYVEDIVARLAELKRAGYRLIDEVPRIGAEGNRIAFVHPSAGGGVLIELEEKK